MAQETITVTFKGASAERLKKLADRTSGGDPDATVRNALQLFEAADKEIKEEGEVIFRSKEGEERSAVAVA